MVEKNMAKDACEQSSQIACFTYAINQANRRSTGKHKFVFLPFVSQSKFIDVFSNFKLNSLSASTGCRFLLY